MTLTLDEKIAEARHFSDFFYDLLDGIETEEHFDIIMSGFSHWEQEYERLVEIRERVN